MSKKNTMSLKEYKQISKAVKEIIKAYTQYSDSIHLNTCQAVKYCDLIDKRAKENEEYRKIVSNWLLNGSTLELRDQILLPLGFDLDNNIDFNVFTIFDSARCKYGHRIRKIEDIKGEYLTRKPEQNKTYRAEGYCRFNKGYQLDDLSDISRCMYLPKGSIVYVV